MCWCACLLLCSTRLFYISSGSGIISNVNYIFCTLAVVIDISDAAIFEEQLACF